MKPANQKARDLLAKLERLADPANNGTAGERANAKRRADKLRKSLDFTAPAECQEDIFSGTRWTRAQGIAKVIYTRNGGGYEVESAVKWAIEGATGLALFHEGATLKAEVSQGNADKLGAIGAHLGHSFTALWDKLKCAPGIFPSDRSLFIRGMLDGVLGETRDKGQALPARLLPKAKTAKAKRGAIASAPGFTIHPYSIALDLGKQIRFSASIDQVAADLQNKITPQIQ